MNLCSRCGVFTCKHIPETLCRDTQWSAYGHYVARLCCVTSFDIGIGDTFSLKVLNKNFDFTIEGIALPDGALANHDGIIDISAIKGALIDANPALAHISDGFHPANSVKIQLADAESAQAYREIILANPNLSHTNVSTTADALTREAFEYKVWILLAVLVICIVILISITIRNWLTTCSHGRKKFQMNVI